MRFECANETVQTAVVLAGGLGTRLRSVVQHLPKPMAPVAGLPFLEHLMLYWIEQGISNFILSVGYLHESISKYFGSSFNGAIINYVIEDTPLGTGGGLLLAVENLPKDKSFLLLNGDTYFEVNLHELVKFATIKNADWCFSLFRSRESGRYMGMDLRPDLSVRRLNSGEDTLGSLANGGVYILNPQVLADTGFKLGQKASLENDIFKVALGMGQSMFGLECSGKFIDIEMPEDYEPASNLFNIYR